MINAPGGVSGGLRSLIGRRLAKVGPADRPSVSFTRTVMAESSLRLPWMVGSPVSRRRVCTCDT